MLLYNHHISHYGCLIGPATSDHSIHIIGTTKSDVKRVVYCLGATIKEDKIVSDAGVVIGHTTSNEALISRAHWSER